MNCNSTWTCFKTNYVVKSPYCKNHTKILTFLFSKAMLLEGWHFKSFKTHIQSSLHRDIFPAGIGTLNLGKFNQRSHKPLTWECSPECQWLPKCISMWWLYLETWVIPRKKVLPRKTAKPGSNSFHRIQSASSLPILTASRLLTTQWSKQMQAFG